MMEATRLLSLLLFTLFILPNVLADDTRNWYAFWPKFGSNNNRLDNVKDGEPATNAEFFEMLKADGAGNLENSTHTFNGGETSWWVAQVDGDKVEKYRTFELVSCRVPYYPRILSC